MVLTDTHTHLYYETDPEKQHQLMQNCFEKEIYRLFLPNVDLESLPLVFELADRYPDNCFPMVGLHPCNVTEKYKEQLAHMEETISQKANICAIGEIGIDLYWDRSTLKIQIEAFKAQIKLAIALDLPIVIHCREAFNEIFDILDQEKHEKLRGIFHCFTGTAEQAHRAIDLGFLLGIGGVLTYKNSGLDKSLEHIGMEHLVLETDSPYLSPVPFRGKPNESSYLIYVAQKLAELKQLPLDTIATITTENSKRVFGR